MQAVVKIIATLTIVIAAGIGILVVLDLISNSAARETLVKTAWVLGIIGIASLALSMMAGPKK